MEVHHHVHSAQGGSHPASSGTGTHRKKWTHYFWEFLMLFLAVFCGFLAENFREHKIEHMRAKQFARSLLNDLKEDTLALKTAIDFGYKKMESIDSLLAQLELPKTQWNDELIYKYQAPAGRVRPFGYNSGTYEQMKSSGSLRYFKAELADQLNQYAVQAAKTKVREDIHVNYAANLLIPFILHSLDARVLAQIQNGIPPSYPFTFRKTDDETIALWINYDIIIQSTQQRTVVEYETMLAKAREIIMAIGREYHP